MTTHSDFYDSPEADQLAQAYRNDAMENSKHHDWIFLICLFLALNI